MSRTTEQITLGYWAIHGLGHPIRLVLHYTKTPFTDKMYQRGGPPDFSPEVWLCEKETLGLGNSAHFFFLFFFTCNLDFPNLPYLFDSDLKITQSKTILYYLGRKFHLIGTTPEQEAHVIMLCEEIHDLRLKGLDLFYGSNGNFETERKQFYFNILKNLMII
jgi:hypothetical protein